MTSALEKIDWHRFLGRSPVPVPPATVLGSVSQEPILITGAGGSIGSALTLKLGAAGARLVLLEAAESNLFDLESEFALCSSGATPGFYLGNASDRALLDEIFTRHHPRLVFHAAAFKHVPLLEEQPFAAIANNIIAAQTLVSIASAHKARVVLLSSDKAVAPASVMGATKRIAEQMVLNSGGTVVRLGNVLGSRGSVAEVFAAQIAAGGPLTITDPAACRYFLTIAEAVDLLVSAAAEPDAPAIFIPDLRSTHDIADLARFMTDALAPRQNLAIKFTRPRAGDKETEALFSSRETPHSPRANGLILLDSPGLSLGQLENALEELKMSCCSRELTPALSILRRLVPDYEPSPTIERLLLAIELPVHNG